MFFLTEIDPNERIKGSRDPLALQSVWARFGRRVVGNLSTVTTSLRNFTTVLLGRYLAAQIIDAGKAPEGERVDLFLKFEQLAAYSRHLAQGDGILGINRVKARLDDREARVAISAQRRHQILSNQKTYGLWGLYSVPARASGMLAKNGGALSALAEELVVKRYLPQLSYRGSKNASEIEYFLTGEHTFDPRGKHATLAEKLGGLLADKLDNAERQFYEQCLLIGNLPGCDATDGLQKRLWELMRELYAEHPDVWGESFNYGELDTIRKRAAARNDTSLADALHDIAVIEPFLVALAQLFGLVLDRSGSKIDAVVRELEQQWPGGLGHLSLGDIELLHSGIAKSLGKDGADRMVAVARDLKSGAYASALNTAVDHSAAVMTQRGGARWVEVKNDTLDVHLREGEAHLDKPATLRSPWVNPYFINSLKIIGHAVVGSG